MRLLVAILFFGLLACSARALTLEEQVRVIDANGQALATLIDACSVETKWASGVHIDWFTGEPDNPRATVNDATHCSAFAASVAERLGAPFLRPPLHSQGFLASAQHRWLDAFGAGLGWRNATSLAELQAAANRGMFAVINKESLVANVSGHIAVVRPNMAPNASWVNANGPQVAQSGSTNYNNVTAKKVFNISGDPRVLFAIYDRQAAGPSLTYNRWTSGLTTYLVDLSTAGSLDAFRLAYGKTSPYSPTWSIASNGAVGKANGTAWTLWYDYKLSTTTISEPFTVSNKSSTGGTASWAPNGATLSLNDTGTRVTLTAVTNSTNVDGITGLWQIAIDNQSFGIFISASAAVGTGTALSGVHLAYTGTLSGASTYNPEFHLLNLNWASTTDRTTASGVASRCVSSRTSVVTCTAVSSAVSLTFLGGGKMTASGLGVTRIPAGAAFIKSTQLSPFLGPVL